MKANVKISVSASKYMKEAVLATCCELASSRNSSLLQKSEDGKFIDVMITVKPSSADEDLGEDTLKATARKFRNILREKQLQIALIKNNMLSCEEIVYNALSNPAMVKENEPDEALPESIAKIISDSSGQGEESYLDDVLKIAVPWEEKKP